MVITSLAHQVIGYLLGNTPFSPPANWHVALYTSAPAADGAGGTEVSGGGYAPATVANNTTNFSAPSAREVANAVVVTFPQASAAWGAIVGVGLKDAAGGNVLMYASFTVPKTVAINDTPSFAAGQLKFKAL